MTTGFRLGREEFDSIKSGRHSHLILSPAPRSPVRVGERCQLRPLHDAGGDVDEVLECVVTRVADTRPGSVVVIGFKLVAGSPVERVYRVFVNGDLRETAVVNAEHDEASATRHVARAVRDLLDRRGPTLGDLHFVVSVSTP